MSKQILIALFLLFIQTSCQCPQGFQYIAEQHESFSLPEKGKYYQAAMVCTDTLSYTTAIFKRENTQVRCSIFKDDGNFPDLCHGDSNKICCINNNEYDTDILGIDGSQYLVNEGDHFNAQEEQEQFSMIEFTSRGNSNFMYLKGDDWKCDHETFGDPDQGYKKKCYKVNTKIPVFNASYPNFEAEEGHTFSTTGASTPVWIGYGEGDKLLAHPMSLQQQRGCDNNMFRDANKNHAKQCYTYQSTQVPSSPPQGMWANVESGTNIEIEITWGTVYDTTITHESSLETSIKDSIEGGVIFEEDTLSIKVSYESSVAFESSIEHSEDVSCQASCEGESVQYLWQWTLGGQMITPEAVKNGYTSQTCHYVCTDSDQPPRCAFSMAWNETSSTCVNNF